MVNVRTALALSLAASLTASAGALSPTPARAETAEVTPAARNLMERLRTSMGLSPRPGEPMRLLPPGVEAPAAPRAVTVPARPAAVTGVARPARPAEPRPIAPPPAATPRAAAATAATSAATAPARPQTRRAPTPPQHPARRTSPRRTVAAALPRRHPARPLPPAVPGPDAPALAIAAAALPEPGGAPAADVTPGGMAAAPVAPVANPPATTLAATGVFADAPASAAPPSAGGTPSFALATYSGDGADAGAEAATSEDAPDLPPPPPSELPRLMRTMSALQDDIARGAASALQAQRILSQRVARTLAADSPRTLAVPRNARALLHYALTGGSPVDVRKAVDRTAFRPPYDALLAGSLAFLEGRQSDARRHFDAVDLAGLGAVVSGPVRLALAALAVEDDPAAALTHLDHARHSAPGTLVEEAALRRAVLLAAERNDLDRFERHAGRYLRKFRASAYAGNFRRRLASALTRMRFLEAENGFDRLAAILAPMSADGRREIYLGLARSAVESGKSGVAATAARLGREIAPTDSLDAQRAELYEAAADVVDPGRNDAAVETLGALDVAGLPQDDQVLRTAALRLGQAVGKLPEPAPPAPPESLIAPDIASAEAVAGNLPALLATAAPVPPEVEDEPSAVELQVRATLADIDALLRTSP
ncbi:MAG: hypothetical protein AcusKO_20500 [Acuticoccus sp.]